MLVLLTVAVAALAAVVASRGTQPPPAAPASPCIRLEGLAFAVCPTSWYRTEAHNEQIGGARHSNHLLGCAVDWVPQVHSQQRLRELEAWAKEHVSGAWIEPLQEAHTHLHVDWRCHEHTP